MMWPEGGMDLSRHIRTIPDYPRPGILFRDVTTLFADGAAFAYAIDRLAAAFSSAGVVKVAGIEARGFIVGSAVARSLGAGFVPVRKVGRLPWAVDSEPYALEYGTDVLEMHRDAVRPGECVLICDDLIATGGTALAATALLSRAGAAIAGAAMLVDLPSLGGARRLEAAGVPVYALLAFAGD
jgi:adenine phosphoribosyltransferase